MSKVMRFDLNSQDIKIKEILNNKDFLKIEVWAISDAYPNNNKSHFPLDTMEVNINEGNFYNKPVLGRWNSQNGDYEVHNSTVKYDPEYDNTYFDYENGEVPIGVIRGTDEIKIVKKDGLNWIVFTAVLWVKYGYQGIKKVLKSRKKKVSVEVSVFDSYIDENDIEVFKKWSFDGVTILGNLPNTKIPAHEGIENAHLTILEKLQEDTFSNQVRALQFAYQELDKDPNVIKEDNSSFNINNEEKEDNALALTYEQKRELLESFLRDNIKTDSDDCWIWVADLSDDCCYYGICGEFYKATYNIIENEAEGEEPIVSVNIGEAIKVVRDWKSFIEEEDNENPESESSENFSNGSEDDSKEDTDDKSDDETKEKPEKKEHSEEEDSTDENFEEEKTDEETFEEDNSEEGIKENETEDEQSEDNSDKEKDTESECGKMSEDQQDDSQDGGQCEMDKDDDSDDKDDDSDDVHDDTNDECTCVLSFNDTEHQVSQEVFDYCNDIIARMEEAQNSLAEVNQQFTEVKTNFENVSEENTNLKNQIKELQYAELSKEAYAMAIEHGFSEEESEQFKQDCLNGKYADKTSITKEIVYQSFLKKQEEKSEDSSQKEFSAKIPQDNKNMQKEINKDNPFAGIQSFVNEK